jgi:hypothetical protein
VRWIGRICWPGLVGSVVMAAVSVQADSLGWLEDIKVYPHTQPVASSESRVVDHEVGLGPLQRMGSSGWGFSRSERLSGDLQRFTWQILDGYTASEGHDWLLEALAELGDTEQLYQCEGRRCGRSVEWANTVFGQRLLYGSDNAQRYTAHRVSAEAQEYRVAIYSIVRPPGRHFLHADILRIGGSDGR